MRLVRGSSDRDCGPLHLSRVLDVTLRDTRQRPKLRLNRASVVADHDLERPEGRTAQVAAVSPSRADSRVRAAPALRDHHGHERQHDDRAAPAALPDPMGRSWCWSCCGSHLPDSRRAVTQWS